MDATMLGDLGPEFRAFVDRAVDACDPGGERAVLLLVGSRAAGFAGHGSDLDLWILKDFHGVLQADAYGGYEGICVGGGITQTGC